jgi:hypothetical protein
MIVVLALINLFKRIQPVISTTPAWYVAMALLSILLGYAVSYIYSEPMNRRLRHLRAHPSM